MIGLYLAVVASGAAAAPLVHPESLALTYLSREVPRWAKENHCYSCHNNGDAARALYLAVRLGHKVPATALADTTRWLERPTGWDHNGGEGPYSDKKLARLQFAASLVEAKTTGLTKDSRAVEQAARLIVGEQAKDGSWKVVSGDTLGSPVTHGNALATSIAVATLRRAGAERHREAIARAEGWLRKAPLDGVLDAAAVLSALARQRDADALAQEKTLSGTDPRGRGAPGRLGALRSLRSGGLRYRSRADRAVGTELNGRDQSVDEARTRLPDCPAATRRKLGGNHTTRGGRQLRATAVDDGMGDDGIVVREVRIGSPHCFTS